jgi:tetratricopeptide (TPR) repeat protein
MGRKRLLTAGTVAALAATVFLFGGTLRDEGGAGVLPVVAAQLDGNFAQDDTKSLVATLEARVAERADAQSLTSLGLAYQQRARETADASYLTRSHEALTRAQSLGPPDATIVGGLASIALARHEFARALALARQARMLAPDTARPFALLGDALVELGRYREAFAAFDELAARKPSLTAYSRIAYARELIGDRAGAREAMTLALDSASGRAEPTAWTRVELGKLAFGEGRLVLARRHFRAALAALPGYPYAFEALAKLAAAEGELRHAAVLARRSAEAVPLPQFVGTLGDVERMRGNLAEANEQYALVGAIGRLLRANGVRTDLELALFDLDHGRRLRAALEQAVRAHRARPSVQSEDVLAWALHRNGRCTDALAHSKRALRLGTRDATFDFHRGMIERCLGHVLSAKRWLRSALELNPHFSLVWAPVARRYAA